MIEIITLAIVGALGWMIGYYQGAVTMAKTAADIVNSEFEIKRRKK